MVLLTNHDRKVKKIAKEIKHYLRTNAHKKIRFSHGSTNSTRVQNKKDNYLIDLSAFDQIVTIDVKKKLAKVEPNVPMDTLVDACLKKGLIPKVVMEFPGITCGGGVNGAALEASSFKYGQFNDTCIEYGVILGNGEIIKTNKKKNTDLFYGISGSYGSLAIITAIDLELIPAKPYIHVTLKPVNTKNIVEEIKKDCKADFDYVEGLILDKESSVLVLGKLNNNADLPIRTFSKPWDEWFYLYAKKQLKKSSETHILVPIKDYLFRYNRGAFWMGKHAFTIFHIPFNRATRYILDPFMNTRTMYRGLHETNIAQNFFIQDFYVPLSQANAFLNLSMSKLHIFPIWLCPIKSTPKLQKLSPHYLQENLLIDVGLWGNVPNPTEIKKINREFERHLEKYQGRKMFYADSFYSEKKFWNIYDRSWYSQLRKKYHADAIFPEIWQKIHTEKHYAIKKWRILKTMIRTLL